MVSEGIFINGEKVTFNPENILNGDVSAYTEAIGEATQDWLDEHLEPGGSVPIDDTLTIAGAAADAKETGDEITELKEDLNDITDDVVLADSSVIVPQWYFNGKYSSHNTQNIITQTKVTDWSSVSYDVESLIGKNVYISTKVTSSLPIAVMFSDANGVLISKIFDASVTTYSNKMIEIPVNAKYMYVNAYLYNAVVKMVEKSDVILADYITLKTDITGASTQYNNIFTSTKWTESKIRTDSVTGAKTYTVDVSEYVGDTIYITTTLPEHTNRTVYCIGNASAPAIPLATLYSNDTVISCKVVVPEGAKTLYVNSKSGEQVSIIRAYSATVEEAAGNVVNTSISGKKCVCFGDSITWYDGHAYNWGKEEGITAKGYESYLREAGMIVDNQGYSGATIRGIVDSKVLAFDFDGFDYVTITSGANDSRYNIPVGEIQTSNFDDTFIGRLQAGIEYILTENPEIKILLITPIMGWIYTPDGYAYTPAPATDGVVEEKYAEAIKTVAKHYSLPVLDWYNNCGLNILTRDWYINDPEPDPEAETNPNILYSLHPSTKGYQRMSDLLLPVIRSI